VKMVSAITLTPTLSLTGRGGSFSLWEKVRMRVGY
jgi:hypothetical protein